MEKRTDIWQRDGALVFILTGTGRYSRRKDGPITDEHGEILQNKLQVNVQCMASIYYREAEKLAQELCDYLNQREKAKQRSSTATTEG